MPEAAKWTDESRKIVKEHLNRGIAAVRQALKDAGYTYTESQMKNKVYSYKGMGSEVCRWTPASNKIVAENLAGGLNAIRKALQDEGLGFSDGQIYRKVQALRQKGNTSQQQPAVSNDQETTWDPEATRIVREATTDDTRAIQEALKEKGFDFTEEQIIAKLKTIVYTWPEAASKLVADNANSSLADIRKALEDAGHQFTDRQISNKLSSIKQSQALWSNTTRKLVRDNASKGLPAVREALKGAGHTFTDQQVEEQMRLLTSTWTYGAKRILKDKLESGYDTVHRALQEAGYCFTEQQVRNMMKAVSETGTKWTDESRKIVKDNMSEGITAVRQALKDAGYTYTESQMKNKVNSYKGMGSEVSKWTEASKKIVAEHMEEGVTAIRKALQDEGLEFSDGQIYRKVQALKNRCTDEGAWDEKAVDIVKVNVAEGVKAVRAALRAEGYTFSYEQLHTRMRMFKGRGDDEVAIWGEAASRIVRQNAEGGVAAVRKALLEAGFKYSDAQMAYKIYKMKKTLKRKHADPNSTNGDDDDDETSYHTDSEDSNVDIVSKLLGF